MGMQAEIGDLVRAINEEAPAAHIHLRDEELAEFLLGKGLHLTCDLLNCGCHDHTMVLHFLFAGKLRRGHAPVGDRVEFLRGATDGSRRRVRSRRPGRSPPLAAGARRAGGRRQESVVRIRSNLPNTRDIVSPG